MNHLQRIIGRIVIVIPVLLNVQPTLSQINFSPGYIINPHGDTLKGYIDYRNWDKNPKIIHFKTDAEGSQTGYTPIDIIEFGVEQEVYKSGIIETEVSPIRTSNLQKDPGFNIRIDTTFLQTLFSGTKDLYYYKNQGGRENFYFLMDSGMCC